MNSWLQRFGRNVDLVFVLLVLGVLAMLFAPVPAGLLDYLIVLNFGFALLVLLITFYAAKPVDFSTFPAILLIATLFRLALNVSATRLILNEGDAGHVIGAVGAYVVSGNYVIGFVVFLILVVVQFVVVTAGAQRVSEVAARFTLDSMPGQQMSIDADLNMGFIDQEEAQRRRKNLEREAAFYGAMDGASKFVKGDAVAGIVIMLINVLGGLVIGVLQMGMSWGDALRQFTLLTIGDGIVTQVPALIVSVGTGLIVTRSSSDSMLSAAAFRQLTAYPKTLSIVAVALIGVGLLPGMPLAPALVIAALVAIMNLIARNRQNESVPSGEEGVSDSKPADGGAGDMPDLIVPVEVVMGPGIVSQLSESFQADIMERVSALRKALIEEMGLTLPAVRFRDKKTLAANKYDIVLHGDVFASGILMVDRWLAIPPNGNMTLVQGVETRDPSYGLPAAWIPESSLEAARAAKCTIVDPVTVMATHLMEVMRHQASYLLTRAEAELLLARVRTAQPGLVEELVPTQLSVGDVQKVLQALVKEGVPIRNIQAIVEALLDGVKTSKDPHVLVEFARQKMGMAICNTLGGEKRTLHVMTLHPDVERRLIQDLSGSVVSDRLAMADPKFTEMLLQRLAHSADRMIKNNLVPILLCPVDLRRHVRVLSERAIPQLRVLSVAEVPIQFDLKAFSSVEVS